MRNMNTNTEIRILGLLAVSALAASQSAFGQDDLEWDPEEGYQEEEWYDPSDWFDDDTVEYPYGDYDYYSGYWDGYTWYDVYDYGIDFDAEYGWDPIEGKWGLIEGDVGDSYSAKYDFSESSVPEFERAIVQMSRR